ncbi:hypothetical protein CDD83_9231 [Cordyceps sp. RAO-2017]|nr:hypothetical protein CDD83_9231 [Cordyceps sp. RAO-2017]
MNDMPRPRAGTAKSNARGDEEERAGQRGGRTDQDQRCQRSPAAARPCKCKAAGPVSASGAQPRCMRQIEEASRKRDVRRHPSGRRPRLARPAACAGRPRRPRPAMPRPQPAFQKAAALLAPLRTPDTNGRNPTALASLHVGIAETRAETSRVADSVSTHDLRPSSLLSGQVREKR